MNLSMSKATLAEFLSWEEAQPARHEFYRGETFAMVGITARHNRVILNLASRIAEHLEGSGCQAFTQSIKVQVADGILYPDVVVTCDVALAGDEQVIADPKLIIEVLSPSFRGYDKREKFTLYRSLSSLREYVLIDPIQRRAEVFTLAANGGWLLTDPLDVVVLSRIDLTLQMADILRGTVGAS